MNPITLAQLTGQPIVVKPRQTDLSAAAQLQNMLIGITVHPQVKPFKQPPRFGSNMEKVNRLMRDGLPRDTIAISKATGVTRELTYQACRALERHKVLKEHGRVPGCGNNFSIRWVAGNPDEGQGDDA